MSNSLYTCNCDVIHEDIVNDVKGKMQPKDDYIQLASLFKLFGDGTRVQILHALEQSGDVCMRPCGSAGRHQIGDLSPAESTPACRTGQIPQRGPDRVLFAGG